MAAIEYPYYRPNFMNNNTVYPQKSASKGKITIKMSSNNKRSVAFVLQNPTKTPASTSKTHKFNYNVNQFADDVDHGSKTGDGSVLKGDNELMLAIRAGSDPTKFTDDGIEPAQGEERAFVDVYSDSDLSYLTSIRDVC